MPVVILLVAGFVAGVCVAPSVRKQPKLQKAFVVVDAFTETVKGACRNTSQAVRAIAWLNRSQPAGVVSLN